MIMTFDNSTAAKTFISIMKEKNIAKIYETGRQKWKVLYTDGESPDYIRVRHI